MPTRRLAALLCLTLAACGDKDPPGEGGLDSGDSGGGGSDTAGGTAPAPNRARAAGEAMQQRAVAYFGAGRR
jgi:hypothetical protein